MFAEPNIAARVPGTPEDLAGALADPEPLFAAPTRLDRIGRVMTQVMVNGKGPFRFVIDTGASRSTLAPHLAEPGTHAFRGPQRHAQRRDRRGRSAHGGRRQHRNRRAQFENQHLPVIFTSIMGNADGILGVAGFHDQRIDVDFKRDRVSVLASNGRRPHYSMVTARAERNDNGLMILDVRVGRRIKAKAVIDTGAERTLGNLALQQEINKNKRGKREPVSAPSCTARRPTSPTATCRRSRRPRIGDMTLTNLEVIFADFHVFKLWGLDQEPAMLIGMDMLGVLERLVIDYRRNEVSMYGDARLRRASWRARKSGKHATTETRLTAALSCDQQRPCHRAHPRPRAARRRPVAVPRRNPAGRAARAAARRRWRDWPAVRAGRESPLAMANYLRGFDTGADRHDVWRSRPSADVSSTTTI